MLKVVALVAVLAIVAAACNSDSGEENASGSASASGDLSGGTLKMAMLADVTAAFDPQKEYYSVTWEYYRCCLLRTLMSYKGVPTAQGGADIFPDLAAADPEVSADGLTWTFTIKPGMISRRRSRTPRSRPTTSSPRCSARPTRRQTSAGTRSTTR